MERLHGHDRRHASLRAPRHEFAAAWRVFGLRMLEAKNSKHGMRARSPALVTSTGNDDRRTNVILDLISRGLFETFRDRDTSSGRRCCPGRR